MTIDCPLKRQGCPADAWLKLYAEDKLSPESRAGQEIKTCLAQCEEMRERRRRLKIKSQKSKIKSKERRVSKNSPREKV